MPASFSATVLSCTISQNALFRVAMTGLGVPTGAYTPNHMPIERLGTPCSVAVGTSRSEAMRCGAVSR